MNPFQYLSAINDTKQDIMVDDISEKQYNAFMVNRGLSYFYDTVLLANEMNQRAHLDNRLQFDFFINIINIYIKNIYIFVGANNFNNVIFI